MVNDVGYTFNITYFTFNTLCTSNKLLVKFMDELFTAGLRKPKTQVNIKRLVCAQRKRY